MHVICTPIGSDGDVLPFVGIGAELARRGHAVTLITNARYEAIARGAGLEFAPCGTEEQYLRIIRSPVRGGLEVLEFASRHLHQAILARHVPGKTVLVSHLLAPGARIAHETLGAPIVTLLLAPHSLGSRHDPPTYSPGVTSDSHPRLNRAAGWLTYAAAQLVGGPVVNRYRATLGLPPERILEARGRLIGLFPDWFAPRAPDWPRDLVLTGFPFYAGRSTPSNDMDAAEEFLGAGSPPIVITPGTANVLGRSFLRAAVDACRRLGRRALVLTPYADQVPGAASGSVRRFAYLPLREILPRAAAIVHHGGIGTCAQGLAAGIPQLIVPFGVDQFDNGVRVERLGAGVTTRWWGARGGVIARKLEGVIESPEVRRRAREAARRLNGADAIGRACSEIERLDA